MGYMKPVPVDRDAPDFDPSPFRRCGQCHKVYVNADHFAMYWNMIRTCQLKNNVGKYSELTEYEQVSCPNCLAWGTVVELGVELGTDGEWHDGA